METETKLRFEESDKQFQGLEKRFDDLKWFFGGAAALFAVFVSLFTIIANSNLSGEKSSLEQFKTDLRADLGKAESLPDLELLGDNGLPLAGQEVRAEIETDEKGEKHLVIRHVMRNKGTGSSGQMFVKIYSRKPLDLGNSSTDEKRFAYEDYILPGNISPNDIPGGYVSNEYWRVSLPKSAVAPGKYPVLLKVYFGRGKVVSAEFVISI